MNKVFNINLGGYPFTIDEDAYEHLRNYLKTIHNHFRSSEGYEEITSDIESRLAELFQEKLSGRPIVTLSTVKDAITVMGTPEDFGAEPLEAEEDIFENTEARSKNTYKSRRQSNYRTGKRLFRNPEDEVVGGVCSGAAAYFGIEDPVWFRLGFAVFFFAGGFALPLYLILWAVMPKAETAADRLAMRGEPITASNIGKIIEEEMERFGEQMTEFGEDINEKFGNGRNRKKKSFAATKQERSTGRAALATGLSALGSALKFTVEFILKIVKPILFIIGIMLIIALSSAWISVVVSLFFGQPYLEHIFPEQIFIANLGISGLLMMVSMILTSIIFSMSPIFFGRKVNRHWRNGAIGLAILSAMAFFGSSSYLASHFKEYRSVEVLQQSFENDDLLEIAVKKNYDNNDAGDMRFSDNGFEIFSTGDMLVVKNFDIFFKRSTGENITVRQEVFARGKDGMDAKNLANLIDFPLQIEGNKLTIPTYFTVPRGTKFRGQKVNIFVDIPQGKSFVLDKSVKSISDNLRADRRIRRQECQEWTMQEGKFVCSENLQEHDIEKEEDTSEVL